MLEEWIAGEEALARLRTSPTASYSPNQKDALSETSTAAKREVDAEGVDVQEKELTEIQTALLDGPNSTAAVDTTTTADAITTSTPPYIGLTVSLKNTRSIKRSKSEPPPIPPRSPRRPSPPTPPLLHSPTSPSETSVLSDDSFESTWEDPSIQYATPSYSPSIYSSIRPPAISRKMPLPFRPHPTAPPTSASLPHATKPSSPVYRPLFSPSVDIKRSSRPSRPSKNVPVRSASESSVDELALKWVAGKWRMA